MLYNYRHKEKLLKKSNILDLVEKIPTHNLSSPPEAAQETSIHVVRRPTLLVGCSHYLQGLGLRLRNLGSCVMGYKQH